MRKSSVPPDPEFITPQVAALLAQAKAGSKEAVQELYWVYGPIFLKIIRKRIVERLRTLMGSDDFLQEVGLRLWQADLPENIFDSPRDFVAFVSKVAENRVYEAERKYLVLSRHNLWREVHMRELHEPPAQDSEEFLTDEEWDVIVRRCKPEHGVVLNFFRDGLTSLEIGHRVGLTEWGVRRIIRGALADYFQLPQDHERGLFA